MAGPTWYDILGVDRSATADEIKAAWRAATDKFEPGSGQGQFMLFNEAADVLLDPERRREYDESLNEQAGRGPAQADRGPTEEELDRPAKPRSEPELAKARKGKVESPSGDQPDVETATRAESNPEGVTPRRSLLVPLLAGLTSFALLVAVVFGVLLSLKAQDSDIGFLDAVVEGDAPARADATTAAAASAERALAAAVSYDYRRMQADKDRALSFMTERYGKKFAETFDRLLTDAEAGKPNNVVKTRTVVQAVVRQVGVMNPSAATTDRVRLLAYVNQNVTKGEGDPAIFQNRVSVTMVKRDGEWLIDGLDSH